MDNLTTIQPVEKSLSTQVLAPFVQIPWGYALIINAPSCNRAMG